MSGDQRRLDPEEWEQPRHRKGRRNDHQVEGNNKVLSKFFVSNLPPKCSSQDLKEVLGRYGRNEGSYIARKLDKWGKRFVFVSFSEVRDIIRLEEELSDVWVGSYKLFISIARFVDGEKVFRPVNIQREKTTVTDDKSHANPSCEGADGNGSFNAKVGNGRSFVDSLLNRNKVDVLKVDDSVKHTFRTLERLCSCWKGDADKFLNDKSLWSVWFESLDWWTANFSVEDGRIAWLQVHGLPAQLALDQVYDMIGSRHGKVVQSASLSGDDNNFSYALIGELSKECNRIVDRVDVSWRGKIFYVWVDEDVGEWIPECVAEFDDDEGSSIPQEENDEQCMIPVESDNVIGEEGEVIRDEVLSSDAIGVSNGDGGVDDSEVSHGAHMAASMGRKKFRRKSLFKNRNEGSGSLERPKKRPRENNDMFGLDRLIGIFSEANETDVNTEQVGEDTFLTPDLNQRAATGTAEFDSRGLGHTEEIFTQTPTQQPIEVEALKTVELSRELGVENLDDFVPNVKEV
ncbi:putative RNA recognition motif domain, nucleotide-binding alpha-beta plait domain superfamily [Helianthus debilis subsp. tardiflorus]